MKKHHKGDFVEYDGLTAVVVGTDDDPHVPEGHLLLWHGNTNMIRKSEDPENYNGQHPEVWSVPAEYCEPSLPVKIQH